MPLEAYNQLGNRDTFTFWLERLTKNIGNISGSYSTIFEIYERKPGHSPPRKQNQKSDEKYTWYARNPGETAAAAFVSVREKLVRIIESAKEGDLEAVEGMHGFPPIARWKIAFMYAPLGTMVAIFSPEMLRATGKGFGLKAKTLAGLHRELVGLKSAGQSIYDYSWDLWAFGKRNHYLIGTKYGENATDSRAEEMFDKSVVSTDFGPTELDLSDFYLSGDTEGLRESLEENDCPDLENAFQNLKTFLNIRIGDLIALKSSGNPKGGKAFLGIVGYAVVVERDDKVYWFDKSLGHCLNVEFLKWNIGHEIEQGGYSKAVVKVENEEASAAIFQELNNATDAKIVECFSNQSMPRRTRSGVDGVAERPQGTRKAIGACVINYQHSKIQSELLEHLKANSPDAVVAEEDYVDIKRVSKTGNWIELYEVKPYATPVACIRESLGQLLDYAHWIGSGKEIRLIVVGPSVATEADKRFIQFVRENLKIQFDYKAWKSDWP